MKKRKIPIVDIEFENICAQQENSSSSHDSDDDGRHITQVLKDSNNWRGQTRKRIKPKRLGKRYADMTDPSVIQQVVAAGCCQQTCLKQFTLIMIQGCRQEFHAMKNKEQSEFIVQQIKFSLPYATPNADQRMAVQGKIVCVNAWRAIFGIKRSGYDTLKTNITKNGDISIEDQRIGQDYPTKKFFGVHQFLTEYSRLFGEDQPNCSDIFLPSCVTRASVFEDYKLKCDVEDQPYVLISRFYEIWKSDFGHVKIRKFQTFSKCTECTNYKEALLKKPSNEEKIKIIEMRSAHLTLQRLCRLKYYKHNEKAKKDPDQYLSLIIDGMDQSKTNLPRFHHSTKADSTLTRMHHHLTGVLCQSDQLYPYAYTWTDQFYSDSNVTLNSLTEVLADISRKRNGRLPPTLYVQADNCAKDNKNNFVLMFLAQLVKAKIFKKIKLNFLMVGHTHEDIDQFFSCISRKLHTTNAETLPKLHQIISDSFNPKPTVSNLDSIWNFKLQFNRLFKIVGLKPPHVFKFTLDDEGIPQMFVKDWPLQDEDYRLTVLPHIPDIGIPEMVEPRLEKMEPTIAAVLRDLQKYKTAGRMTEDDSEWWTTYLQGLREPTRPRPTTATQEALPIYQNNRRDNRSVLDSTLRTALNESIARLQHVSDVRLGRQRITL